MADPAAAAQAFDVRTVPVIAAEQEMQDRRKKDVFVEEAPSVSAASASKAGGAGGAAVPGNDERGQELRAEVLAKVPELASLGPLLISSKQIELTESEVHGREGRKGREGREGEEGGREGRIEGRAQRNR